MRGRFLTPVIPWRLDLRYFLLSLYTACLYVERWVSLDVTLLPP